jgi:hypothetical protein
MPPWQLASDALPLHYPIPLLLPRPRVKIFVRERRPDEAALDTMHIDWKPGRKP